MKISYIRRLENEWTDSRFLRERDGIEMAPALLNHIEWRNGEPFSHDGQSLHTDVMYFRAIGREYEQAGRLVSYAMKHDIPVIDQYLVHKGPGPRGKLDMEDVLYYDGVPTPVIQLWFIYLGPESIAEFAPRKEYPYILKTDIGGRKGKNTWLIRREDDIEKLVGILQRRRGHEQFSKFLPKRGSKILVQDYYENDGDYRAVVVCDKPLGCIKRTRKKRKIVQDKSAGDSAFLRDDEVEDLAVHASRAMGVDFAGVDIIATDMGLMVIEVNEAPSFKAFERRSGIDVADEFLGKLKEEYDG